MGVPESLLSGSYKSQTTIPPVGRRASARRYRIPRVPVRPGTARSRAESLADRLFVPVTEDELRAAELVAGGRPKPLRDYDQISMRAGDLLRQAKLMQPLLAGRHVAFMGDNDGASLLFGLLGALDAPQPERMLMLDFDRRLLARAAALAAQYGFGDRLEVRAYNAFDAIPADLRGRFDVFYTNPPYGSHNDGASGRLFITRGIELCRTDGGAAGCVILPDDEERPWTHGAMHTTQRFLTDHGWAVREKLSGLHRYHLPSDPGLTSGTLWISDVRPGGAVPLPDAGLCVPPSRIVHFYGRKIEPPYPHYILEDGGRDYAW